MAMDETPKRRRRRDRTSAEGTSFMDTVREGFVRWIALEKWREVDDLRMTLDLSWARALEEAGRFPGRGSYEPLWVGRWREYAGAVADGDPGTLFAAIERAVAAALRDEDAERRARGDGPLEDDAQYRRFVGTALDKLLREAASPMETP